VMWREHSLISAELVASAWNELTHGEEPWSTMIADDRTGEIRRVVEALLDPRDGLESPSRRRRIRRAAARHGAFRGAQRCTELVVFDDFYALRAALRCVLRRRASRVVARDVVRLLLPDWRLARRAARTSHAEVRGGA